MSRKPQITSPGLKHLFDTFIGDDPALLEQYAEAAGGTDVAQQIYDLRTEAGYSQRELADAVGTTASVICRLEDADYEGHSLTMLRRIASALGCTIRVSIIAQGKERGVSRGKNLGKSVGKSSGKKPGEKKVQPPAAKRKPKAKA